MSEYHAPRLCAGDAVDRACKTRRVSARLGCVHASKIKLTTTTASAFSSNGAAGLGIIFGFKRPIGNSTAIYNLASMDATNQNSAPVLIPFVDVRDLPLDTVLEKTTEFQSFQTTNVNYLFTRAKKIPAPVIYYRGSSLITANLRKVHDQLMAYGYLFFSGQIAPAVAKGRTNHVAPFVHVE